MEHKSGALKHAMPSFMLLCNAILNEADKWTFRVTVKAQGPQVTFAYNCNSNFNVALVQNGFADFIF